MALGFSDIIKWGVARLTGAQRTAGGTAVPALTAGNALLDASGATIATGLPAGLTYSSNTFQQQNGTAAQAYRLWRTGSGANSGYSDIRQDAASGFIVDSVNTGTVGTPTNLLDVRRNGTSRFLIDQFGQLTCEATGGGMRYNCNGGFDIGQEASAMHVPDSWIFQWRNGASMSAAKDLGFGRNAAGVGEINNGTAGQFRDIRLRSVIQQPPASITPASNGDLVFEATSNTSLTIKLRGSDGTVRSAVLTLA